MQKNNLKDLRSRHDISEFELAQSIGTTEHTIQSIEINNEDIPVSLAYKLASYFNCDLDEVFPHERNLPTATDKALWFANIVRFTSEELGEPLRKTIQLLEQNGLADKLIKGYCVWHTQGYEYIAGMLVDKLKNGE